MLIYTNQSPQPLYLHKIAKRLNISNLKMVVLETHDTFLVALHIRWLVHDAFLIEKEFINENTNEN